jgi:hypothetical protein
LTKSSRRLRAHALLIGVGLVGIAIMANAPTVLGAPMAKPGPGPSSSGACTLSSGGIGQELVLTGSGFASNSQYLVLLSSPGGSGMTTADTDPSGAFSDVFWTYWSGTYTAEIWTEGHRSSEVASCATTVP